ncbi:tRNA (adenosine(37)-N6)-threonylcarbamoyltransferase complex transferase subunit TsaD [Candidatus Woesebacteria bacterium RIFCSPHIGHO2_01_FULL_37_10]|uniref:tRNA N6-adenosine threonylcarbamoyltransferase n=1 Tax=Candidatus Woesebacteria bacterium RIFCSPHIGHO2_01_FULL_37_10 TaxID=1802489 RepID=A0A1F7XWI2_9BACT|nr:MAG: tRNA (adenosine(37)-N6)-threonylcarbamoyltransferase complex transferase subunit TsaD [Candidatus Woesebacteria bacterium RIFCSPHIGHO2_01_FULL_37_10]
MKILSIDTSCDETAAAVTEGTKVLSNVIWSQASLHAKFGGVYPSLAQREHKERIDFVVNSAISKSQIPISKINAIAVTTGPGLAIALEVGIKKAKELCKKYNKPLIAVNHLEGHILSPLASPKITNYQFSIINEKKQESKTKKIQQNSKSITDHQSLITNLNFPALGLVVSGGNTLLARVDKIGKYEVLAKTKDDALGEALDKGARMLGLGYPGGAILEKFARDGNPKAYDLPTPLIGQENLMCFSYSGLKTALYRLSENEKGLGVLTKEQITNLAASYQDKAFAHLVRVVSYIIRNSKLNIQNIFVGGGVAANTELRKRIRKMCKENGIAPLFPYSKKLYTDNAAMIGVAAYFKAQRKEFVKDVEKVDRIPKYSLNNY